MTTRTSLLLALLVAVGVCLQPAASDTRPAPWFRDATKEYGPIGGGPAAFADLDGDGRPDLLCDGKVYRNDGGKRFADVTKDSGLAGSGAACVADVDNDGRLDVYYCGGEGRLYRNLGGFRFEDWSKKVPPNKHTRSQAAAFADIDGDGHVDLYVSNYEDWKDNTYPFPDVLYRNLGGDKGFAPWWEAKGDQVLAGRGVVCFDVEGDGRAEVFVSNYRLAPNFLWAFDKEAGLRDRGAELGVAGTPGPAVRYGTGTSVKAHGHTIGSCVGDFDNDGLLDVFVANFSHPPAYQNRPQFLRNGGPPGFKFEDKSEAVGLRWQESYAVAAAGDVDNDGRLDFVLTTVYPGDRSVLYRNRGDWKFADATKESGLAAETTYQASFADIDGDGRLDLVCGGKVWLNTGGAQNHHLTVRLVGVGTCNRAAVGSRVVVEAGGRKIARQVEAGTGSGSQNDLTLHFGLSDAAGPVRVTVHWAGGGTSTHKAEVDRTVVLRKGE